MLTMHFRVNQKLPSINSSLNETEPIKCSIIQASGPNALYSSTPVRTCSDTTRFYLQPGVPRQEFICVILVCLGLGNSHHRYPETGPAVCPRRFRKFRIELRPRNTHNVYGCIDPESIATVGHCGEEKDVPSAPKSP